MDLRKGIRASAAMSVLLAAAVVSAQERAPQSGAGAAAGASSPVGVGQTVTPTPPPQTPSSQTPGQPAPAAPAPATQRAVTTAGIVLPPGYVIGPDDILNVVFWREKEMSADVVVRPDGMITLPLISDVQASGLTPEQLRIRVQEQASKFIEDPRITVVVKQINSRKVFVTGLVGRPGAYPLSNPTTVLQLLSMAGGVHEFADSKKIIVLRTQEGQQKALKFNYKDVIRGRNLQQNILLEPGDTIVVP